MNVLVKVDYNLEDSPLGELRGSADVELKDVRVKGEVSLFFEPGLQVVTVCFLKTPEVGYSGEVRINTTRGGQALKQEVVNALGQAFAFFRNVAGEVGIKEEVKTEGLHTPLIVRDDTLST